MKKKITLLSAVVCCAGALQAQVNLQHHSITPVLTTINTGMFPGVISKSLISSDDTLTASPTFRFGGSADGAGLLKNSDGTFTLITNHEDNFAVSRVILDSTFKPITGEYLLNSNAGMWRLCSATMATPQVHGFGPVFLTCGESSAESMTHAVNPYGSVIHDSLTSAITTLTGLGKWNAENAVPLPATAFPGQTIVLIGDDDSGPNGGQLAMYVANGIGNLNNGTLYVLRRTDLNQVEKNIPMGSTVPVEFVPIPGHLNMTGSQINSYSDATLSAMKFQRVEDIDYRKGSSEAYREIYFNATGAATADSVTRTVWGRVYRLILNPQNPLTGTLECVINGDDKSITNPHRLLYQPDNIVVTEDYVYVQEDPNGYTFPAALAHVHDGNIYQYDIETGDFNVFLSMDHHRSAPDSVKYNRNSAGTAYQNSAIGSWEFGAMMDVSEETGIDNTFIVCVQPHTWRYPHFAGIDGGTLRPNEKQGSLIITVENVPRIKVKQPQVTNQTICQGTSATLYAEGGTTYSNFNGTTYHWYTQAVGGSPVFTGSTFITPVLNSTTTYYVSAEASGSEGPRTATTVTVTPLPATPVITQNGLTLQSSIASGNQWYRNGNMLLGSNSNYYFVTQDGFYSVEVSQNLCTGARSPEVFVHFTGVNEVEETQSVAVFPNPTEGDFTLIYKPTGNEANIKIWVTNELGQLVYSGTTGVNANGIIQQTISLGHAASGVYVVMIMDGGQLVKKKIIKNN